MGPSLCAAHNQHDEFARLEEAERNGTITKEDKIKLDEWRRKESEGGRRGGALFWGWRGDARNNFAHPPAAF